jgi:hypothetical protein
MSPLRVSVKTTVPAKSAGRTLDALTDVIRPLTEWMGLKADQFRLQREEVALQVAVLAAKRIQIEKRQVTPVPLKAIVPLLERASLEEPGDRTMVDLWANLLASAATGRQANVPRYVSILSEINGRHARLIQQIMLKGRSPKNSIIDAELLSDDLWAMDQAGVLLRLEQDVKRVTVNRIAKVIRNHLDYYGVALSDILLNKGEDQWDFNKGLFPVDEHRLDMETLESLNLLKDASFKYAPFRGYEISVFFYRVTPLCIDMFSACNPDIFTPRQHDEEPAAGAR